MVDRGIPMKTVSTKLDSKSHEYLIDLANKNSTTVSDVMRDMVDGLIQNEGMQDKALSDVDRRKKIGQLDAEMDRLERLLDQDISEEKRRQYLEQNWKLENTISSLLGEESDMLENSLFDIFGHKSWFSSVDKFLDYVKRYDIPLLEALDDAMRRYLEYRNEINQTRQNNSECGRLL
jgi:hypothetical protein